MSRRNVERHGGILVMACGSPNGDVTSRVRKNAPLRWLWNPITSVRGTSSFPHVLKRRPLAMTLDRRTFLKNAGFAAAATKLHILEASAEAMMQQPAATAASDHIQFALIGAGIQGQSDTRTALLVPGVKLVAVADCYDGRLAHCKELWGPGTSNNVDLFTTRDYREILARKDVDAVLIATPGPPVQAGRRRRHARRQRRLPRKADDPPLLRRSRDHLNRPLHRPHPPGRQPACQLRHILQGQRTPCLGAIGQLKHGRRPLGP